MKANDREEAVDQREAWFRLATRCAAQIRKQCGTPDKETEQRIMRVFRAALRPRGQVGRKPDRETVRAAELWIGGMLRCRVDPKEHPTLKRYQRGLWQRIYREVFSAPAHAAVLWIAGVERYGGLKRHQRGLWQRIYRDVIPDYANLDKLTHGSTAPRRCAAR